MDPNSPQPLPYFTPVQVPLPRYVRVISIVGICAGLLTLAYRAAALITIALWAMNQRGRWLSRAHEIYGSTSAIIFSSFSIILIISCIGCLARKPWARKWLVRYAKFYLTALALDTIFLFMTFNPLIISRPETLMPGDYSTALGIVISTLLCTAMGSVLPLFILTFMRTPQVNMDYK